MHQFPRFIFGIKLYMFRTVPVSVIRSFSLYTQQWYMSYRFADSLRAGSGRNLPDPARKLSAHIPLLCVQWKTPDYGQRNCPKHVEFYSRNKFEKLVPLICFIIRIYHDARSHERQFITMHGRMNVNLSRCTVTRTSIYHDARSHEHQFTTMHGHPNVNLSRCTVTWTSIYHDARSHERPFITMHGHMNVNLSRCTVTWTSIYHDARLTERQIL